jgi:hypothetical protein
MGVPRLKIKTKLNHRKAKRADVKEYRCCWHCSHVVYALIYGIGTSGPIKQDWRCTVFGVKNGRRYAVGINELCDKFDKRPASKMPEGFKGDPIDL